MQQQPQPIQQSQTTTNMLSSSGGVSGAVLTSVSLSGGGKRPTETPARGNNNNNNSLANNRGGRGNNRRNNKGGGAGGGGGSGGGGGGGRQRSKQQPPAQQRKPSVPLDEDYISSDDEYSSFSSIDDMIVSNSHLGGASKKSTNNLNHLLNFSYVSYADEQRRERGGRILAAKRNSNRTTFQKERFVQANYRFVVKDTGDYRKNLIDPDVSVDWDDILQVHLSTDEPYNCPICLEEPVVGKITKCGHIFCWTCLIRYMEGKAWKRCPICFESVNLVQLKSVAIESISGTTEGQTVSFSLMQRAKDSTIPIPKTRWTPYRSSHFTHYTSKDAIFSKLSLISDATPLFQRESKALEDAISAAQATQDESLPYLAEAQSQLVKKFDEWLLKAPTLRSSSNLPKEETGEEEREMVDSQPSPPLLPSPPSVSVSNLYEKQEYTETEEANDIWNEGDGISDIAKLQREIENMGKTKIASVSSFVTTAPSIPVVAPAVSVSTTTTTSSSSSSIPTNSVEVPTSTMRSSSEGGKPSGETNVNNDVVMFYQETSGTMVFLNPVNSRMLLEEYGSYDRFPLNLTGNVLEVEEVVVSDELRKRYKYFRHLPLSCQVLFCEIDMSSLVSPRTMRSFASQLRRRAEKRRQRQLEASQDSSSSSSGGARRQPNNMTSYSDFPSIYEELHQIAVSSGGSLAVEPPQLSDLPPIGNLTGSRSTPVNIPRSAPDSYAAMATPLSSSSSSTSSTSPSSSSSSPSSSSSSSSSSSAPSFSEALRNATPKARENALLSMPFVQVVEKKGKGKGKGKKGGQQLFVLSNSSSRGYGRN